MANKEKDFLKEFKKDFIAGSASGAAVTLATQPLDTAAVMAQAGTSEVSSNFNQNFKPAGKGAGKLKGLAKLKRMYRGTSPRLIKSTAAGAIGYPVFMAAADILDKNANLNTKGMKEHINLNPAQMKQLSHTEKDNEFRQADSMLTQDAIDHIVKKVLNRPGALGTRKEKLQYSPVQKEASWLNFARGLIGASSKGAWKTKSYLGGTATGIGAIASKPASTKTTLEKTIKNSSGFNNVPTLKNLKPTLPKLKLDY